MDDPTVTTSAQGRASGQPDRVDLQFSATATESDVTSARRTVAERAAVLREVLDDAGVPSDQVRTTGFRVNRPPPNRGPQSDPDDRPYEGTESVRVTLYGQSRIDPVLSTAVDEAGVEVDDVTFGFRIETRRDLQQEAIADAVETAREKAAAAAVAEGMRVSDALSIVTDGGNRPRKAQAWETLAADTGGSGSVESGPLDVTISVEVEYALEATESA